MRRTSALVLVAILAPGCTIFGPCDDDTFGFLNLAGLTGDAFVDPCPLIATSCGDGEVPSPFTPCGLDFTDACGCFGEFVAAGGERAAGAPRGPAFDYGEVSATAVLVGTPPAAGLSPGFQASFTLAANQLQTFTGVITLPDGFGFNGFDALGPAGTQIGAYGLDINLDGRVDFSIPVRSIDADRAFADVDRDGALTAGFDATIEHTSGSHVFTTSLPRGGDGSVSLFFGPRTLRVRVGLFPGIVVNPPEGMYALGGVFTSVDPDTGGASDGGGDAPAQFIAPPQQLAIGPSPLAGVDHFLCYKAKLSKGKLCAQGAPTNAGAACTVEEDCGGTSGTTVHCIKNKPAKGVESTLADAIEPDRPFLVRKPLTLCVPSDPNGEGIIEPTAHLRGYAITPTSGPASPKLTGIPVLSRLGASALDTTKVSSLLVPTAKGVGAPVAPLAGGLVDHYKCYAAKFAKKRCAQDTTRTCKRDLDCDVAGPCLLKFPKGIQVTVGDQLTAARVVDVKKPTRLCLPAARDGSAATHDAALACYQVRPAKGEPKHAKVAGLHLTNAIGLGRERADTVKEDELCVPAVAVVD